MCHGPQKFVHEVECGGKNPQDKEFPLLTGS